MHACIVREYRAVKNCNALMELQYAVFLYKVYSNRTVILDACMND